MVRHESVRDLRRRMWALSRPTTYRTWRLAPLHIVGLTGALILAAVLVGFWDHDFETFAIIYAIGLVGVFLARPIYAADRLARRTLAQRAQPTGITVTDAEVTIDLPGTQIVRYWSAVHSAEENYGVVILRNAKGASLAAICLACAGPQQAAELRMFLVGRGLLPQTYKIKI